MKPSFTIDLPNWAGTQAARRLIAALSYDGNEARFAGGAVRDSLIGRSVTDVDIATTGAAEANMQHLAAEGFSVYPTGLDHGTITVVTEGHHFEVTTLRQDVETDGRHALVRQTDDWLTDAARRDFTINAMYLDLTGQVYDPFAGVADLKAGRIRFIGAASDRIKEDYLRVLRFFRFHAWYGDGEIDEDGLTACAAAADKLVSLSRERITQEFLKLLSAPDPHSALVAMTKSGVLQAISGRNPDLAGIQGFIAAEQGLQLSPNPLRRMSALLPDWSLTDVSQWLMLSKKQLAYIEQLITPPFDPDKCSDPILLRDAVYHYGPEVVADILLLSGQVDVAMSARTMTVPALPVKGADLLAMGLPSGPIVGDVLRELESWWLAQPELSDRQQCLTWVRDRVASLK